MTANVGNIDRILRLVVGAILVVWAAMGLSGVAQIVALIVGVVALATAGMRFCPAYRLLGINTCRL